MQLTLLPIWRLKVRSKVGQIKKDSRRFVEIGTAGSGMDEHETSPGGTGT